MDAPTSIMKARVVEVLYKDPFLVLRVSIDVISPTTVRKTIA